MLEHKKKRAKVQPQPSVNIYDRWDFRSEILHVKLAKLRSTVFPPPPRSNSVTNRIPFQLWWQQETSCSVWTSRMWPGRFSSITQVSRKCSGLREHFPDVLMDKTPQKKKWRKWRARLAAAAPDSFSWFFPFPLAPVDRLRRELSWKARRIEGKQSDWSVLNMTEGMCVFFVVNLSWISWKTNDVLISAQIRFKAPKRLLLHCRP